MKNGMKFWAKKRILTLLVTIAVALTVLLPAMPAMAFIGPLSYYNTPPSGPAVDATFKTNGYAYNDPVFRNVVILTPSERNVFGSVMNENKLDLSKSFRCVTYLYQYMETTKKGTVGDGIAFLLHNDPRGVYARGWGGNGMNVYAPNFDYVKNSMVIEIDSYYDNNTNFASCDPYLAGSTSHSAFVFPKSSMIFPMDHFKTQFFYQSIAWRKLTVEWTPQYNGNVLGGTLSYNFDAFSGMSSYTIANVNSIFGGSQVWWGFSSATGANGTANAVAFKELPAPVANATINVLHKDQNSGAILKAETFTVPSGYYGTYQPAKFNGYEDGTLAPGSAAPSGTIAAGEIKTIVYNYKQITVQPATVIVIHLTESGTLLKAEVKNVNSGYYGPFLNESFAGYSYVGLDPYSDAVSGMIGGGQLKFITHRYR